MRVIVAGSRSIKDPLVVRQAICDSGFSVAELVCGMAPGPDLLAADWAREADIPRSWSRNDPQPVHLSVHCFWGVEEHHCCGFIWQLLLNSRFPERLGLPAPICPRCGGSL